MFCVEWAYGCIYTCGGDFSFAYTYENSIRNALSAGKCERQHVRFLGVWLEKSKSGNKKSCGVKICILTPVFLFWSPALSFSFPKKKTPSCVRWFKNMLKFISFLNKHVCFFNSPASAPEEKTAQTGISCVLIFGSVNVGEHLQGEI